MNKGTVLFIIIFACLGWMFGDYLFGKIEPRFEKATTEDTYESYGAGRGFPFCNGEKLYYASAATITTRFVNDDDAISKDKYFFCIDQGLYKRQ